MQTIVVVEDEAAIADAVATRLRSEGFAVEVAHDGLAGVELCRRVAPDLVVLDLMLPGLDGLEVCRRVQAEREVAVLMLTARDSETDLLVGLAVGADDYLTKPFSPRELVARIRCWPVALILVIVAVAFRRLWLYQQAYALTMLRLSAGVAIVSIGIVFVLLAATFTRWLPPRRLVAAAGVCSPPTCPRRAPSAPGAPRVVGRSARTDVTIA